MRTQISQLHKKIYISTNIIGIYNYISISWKENVNFAKIVQFLTTVKTKETEIIFFIIGVKVIG